MGFEDTINRLFIRIVMGGKYLKVRKNTDETLPEAIGSVKKFFEGGVAEFKKDILKQKQEEDPEL